MKKKVELALLIGIIVVLGFILVFYENNPKDTSFEGSYNKHSELTTKLTNLTNNQPQKIGSVTVKGGETNRIDIKEV